MVTKTLFVLLALAFFVVANAAIVRRDTEAADSTEKAQVEQENPESSSSGQLSRTAQRFSSFVDRLLGKLESQSQDDSFKDDVETIRQSFREGKFNETFEKVSHELGAEGGHLSPKKVFDSLSEQAPEGFKAVVQRIRDFASSHFDRLSKHIPRIRAQVEEGARQAFSSIADLFAN